MSLEPLVPNRLDDEDSALIILDQTLLPNEVKYLALHTNEEICHAIKTLQVRGAPAIGVAAGYGAYLGAKSAPEDSFETFYAHFRQICKDLAASRPTAVNLFWALKRMEQKALSLKEQPVKEIKAALKAEALAIHEEDIAQNKAISQYGLSLLKPGDGLLTHCNAGPIATSMYGTALGPIRLGQEKGYNFKVFADETRPLLQGARLTAFELHRAGVDVTLICDNMASMVMKNGWVQACLVGCDRVAANGDAANKIGTSGVAILAKHYGIPFYVLGPTTTIDLNTPTGADIPIEQRDPGEIRSMWYEKPMAPDCKMFNPAFDVTDHELIAGIFTEKGIARPPYTQSLQALFEKE